MTLRPALDRLARGFHRMGTWTVRAVQRRPASTEGQLDQARETEVSLGLMAAAAGGAEMAPEQQIFLSQSEHGMRERLSVLLGIPHRSLAQEREKLAIEGWLAPKRETPRISRFAAMPALGLLGGVRLWMILATGWALTVGFLGVQMAVKERIEDQRDDAIRAAEANREAAQAWRERSEEYRQAVIDAGEVARFAADALEAERARQARAAARERRRQREIQDVIAGAPEPPAWGLRDDGAADRDSDATP